MKIGHSQKFFFVMFVTLISHLSHIIMNLTLLIALLSKYSNEYSKTGITVFYPHFHLLLFQLLITDLFKVDEILTYI